jgi:hypothetical protein
VLAEGVLPLTNAAFDPESCDDRAGEGGKHQEEGEKLGRQPAERLRNGEGHATVEDRQKKGVRPGNDPCRVAGSSQRPEGDSGP